jgi:hypothetical protein
MTSRPPRLRARVVAFGGLAVLGVLILGSTARWMWAEQFSRHKSFYETCRTVPIGADSRDALRVLRAYVVADRRLGSIAINDDLIRAGKPPGVDARGEATLLFYPTSQDTADWCIVHFQGNRVARTSTHPD